MVALIALWLWSAAPSTPVVVADGYDTCWPDDDDGCRVDDAEDDEDDGDGELV